MQGLFCDLQLLECFCGLASCDSSVQMRSGHKPCLTKQEVHDNKLGFENAGCSVLNPETSDNGYNYQLLFYLVDAGKATGVPFLVHLVSQNAPTHDNYSKRLPH